MRPWVSESTATGAACCYEMVRAGRYLPRTIVIAAMTIPTMAAPTPLTTRETPLVSAP